MESRIKPHFFVLMATFAVVCAGAANAKPKRIATDTWRAYDEGNNAHTIKVNYVDREGDVSITVRARGNSTDWWINCENDLIAFASVDAEWEPVDHRKMEGWYSDVACELN
jgi:hypothetical protein